MTTDLWNEPDKVSGMICNISPYDDVSFTIKLHSTSAHQLSLPHTYNLPEFESVIREYSHPTRDISINFYYRDIQWIRGKMIFLYQTPMKHLRLTIREARSTHMDFRAFLRDATACNVTELYMDRYTGITPDVIEEIVICFPKLQVLFLDDCPNDPEECEEWIRMLPQLRHLVIFAATTHYPRNAPVFQRMKETIPLCRRLGVVMMYDTNHRFKHREDVSELSHWNRSLEMRVILHFLVRKNLPKDIIRHLLSFFVHNRNYVA